MSAKRKSFKVRHGNNHVTIAPWTHPASGAKRWRMAYRPDTGSTWQYLTFKTKEDATAAAEKHLRQITSTADYLDTLTPARRRWLADVSRSTQPDDERKILDFLRSLGKSASISGAVDRFTSSRTSRAGEETPHGARVRSILENLSTHFPGKSVAEIHLPELQQWFDTRTAGLGWKRKKDIRASCVQFFKWAQKEGIAGNDPVSAAERLPEIGGKHGERAILTRAQYSLLREAIHEDFRAWLILGCFAGLRPEEIAPGPSKKAAKRGIRCEEIDWNFNVIRIAPETSKVGLPRIVPLSEACRAGLLWARIEPGMTGPVCLTNPSNAKELARLGKSLFGGAWPKDICRHSYGSYRNAVLRDLGKVAEEMGTSIAMLHRHYHNPQPTQEGEAWFAIRPGVLICSDEIEVTDLSAESKSI
jgi:integrase